MDTIKHYSEMHSSGKALKVPGANMHYFQLVFNLQQSGSKSQQTAASKL